MRLLPCRTEAGMECPFIRNLGDLLDRARQQQGGMLDAMGLGPVETPFRTVLSMPAFTLRAYGYDGLDGPAVLIVPAPIKRGYIWDLAPQASAVRRLLGSGIRVYLIWWESPGTDEQGLGLADYAERSILSCLGAMSADLGREQPFLAGHSLGGTFAAIFASLYPDMLQGIALLGAPLRFGPGVGDIDSLVARCPDVRVFTGLLGNVPGSFISAASTLASPSSFQVQRWSDWFGSLFDIRLMQMHLRVVRWTLDELAMPRLLFEEIMELLYREDRFMKGTLRIGGKTADPRKVDAPILTVADRRSTVVPPQASLPLHDASGSADTRVVWYRGDAGVALQHAGVLVGKGAHRYLWPEITGWFHAHRAA